MTRASLAAVCALGLIALVHAQPPRPFDLLITNARIVAGVNQKLKTVVSVRRALRERRELSGLRHR